MQNRHLFRLFMPWLLACVCWLPLRDGHASNLPPVPELSARVMDSTATLTPAQRQQLDAKLAAFESTKGTQLAVLIVPSTAPETIEGFANRVADTWKIGRKEVGDGMLLVVAKDDRQLRIEVSRTLEGAVTDLQASRIIQDAIVPRFKQGDFAGGIDKGIDQLIALVNHEPLPATAKATAFEFSTAWFIKMVLCELLISFVCLVIISKGEIVACAFLALTLNLLALAGSGFGLIFSGSWLGFLVGHPVTVVLELLLLYTLDRENKAAARFTAAATSTGMAEPNAKGPLTGTILGPKSKLPASPPPTTSPHSGTSATTPDSSPVSPSLYDSDSDSDSNSDSGPSFSSGGGGSFGGGGASGRW